MNLDQIGKLTREHIYSQLLPPLEWPFLDQVMSYWLKRHKNRQYLKMDILPCLTCKAVGGNVESAIPLAGFWIMAFFASKVFDGIQDDDEQYQPWMSQGTNQAISLGLALISMGNSSLAYSKQDPSMHDILQAFGRTYSLAAKSQTDSQNDLSLESYFENIIASTGQAVSCAAWSGARLVTDDSDILTGISNYGLNIGIRMAIVSDCHGLRPIDAKKKSDVSVGAYKLPIIYAVSLKEHPDYQELKSYLTGERLNKNDTERILNILDKMQAVEWCMNLANEYYDRALTDLASMPSGSVVPQVLTDYVS